MSSALYIGPALWGLKVSHGVRSFTGVKLAVRLHDLGKQASSEEIKVLQVNRDLNGEATRRDHMPTALGETIRRYREAQTLTQYGLSKLLSVSRASVNMWERGKSVPGESRLRLIARVLKADPIEFLPTDAIDAVISPRRAEEFTLPVLRTFEITPPTNKADFFIGEEIVARIKVPGGLPRRDLRVVYVIGNAMFPRYKSGEPILLGSLRQAQVGDYVLITLKPSDGISAAHPALLRELRGRSATTLRLRAYHPTVSNRTLKLSDIEKVEVVLTPAEVLLLV